jgi:hypothetical protein
LEGVERVSGRQHEMLPDNFDSYGWRVARERAFGNWNLGAFGQWVGDGRVGGS